MGKKIKPKKVLILGSGALKIGQAGEFDYSGSQALKALKEEGIKSILINPNIATIQTDEGIADSVYFLPVEPYFVEEVIKKEKCDAIFLSFGGQTALNCGLELEETGVLKKYGVKVLGTPVKTIRDTEDRNLFINRLDEIGVKTARSKAVKNTKAALKAAEEIGYPVMIRAGFALGGKGSAVANNAKECEEVAELALTSVPQILVEEYLKAWKEVEYEVVRDGEDNCITVCNMENFDPMGIHTGESIVVAPSQTLDDYDYQMLRDVAIKTIRHLGIVGECNIQYALDSKSREYRVIEVNARLSRSSALASKATGYPLAYVAAKIGLGYSLPEIPNAITKTTTAFFEPALDYIVCKMPRWDLDKFDKVSQQIGSEMKSVGEVMAIGRSFPEVLQKAIRMLDIGAKGLETSKYKFKDIKSILKNPTPKRIFAIAEAIEKNISVDEIHKLTGIDKFFLHELECAINLGKDLKKHKSKGARGIKPEFMLELKKAGFSDGFIADKLGIDEKQIRQHRHKLGIRPHIAQIDTMAAEYPAETNFLYFTYAATEHDIKPSKNKKILVLGSGCYRIGSSVEFDWCAVSGAVAAKSYGYETVMLNCNPETVSTDYDVCDQLVFDEISLETVLELCDFDHPEGVALSLGGQTPNSLALGLEAEKINILGTSAKSIDLAEDRSKFSALLDKLEIGQPKWASAWNIKNIEKTVESLGGYPVLVRPSYVLSGAAMRVASSGTELKTFLSKAAGISKNHPVVVSKFIDYAREFEYDAVAEKGEVKIWAISEHVEYAGVHSGDATLVIPPQRINIETLTKAREVGSALAKELNITGPFNIQMIAKDNNVKVIECNLRASRSFPFVSKALKVNFIKEAMRAMLQEEKGAAIQPRMVQLKHVAVKAPQFSFSRLKGADPRLRVEMASTGEVGCFGETSDQALIAAMLSVGFKLPEKAVYVSIEPNFSEHFDFIREGRHLQEIGLDIYADGRTTKHLRSNDIKVKKVIELPRKDGNEIEALAKSGKIDLVISIPSVSQVKTSAQGFRLRRMAVDLETPLITDIWLARRLIRAMQKYREKDAIPIRSWNEYVDQMSETGN